MRHTTTNDDGSTGGELAGLAEELEATPSVRSAEHRNKATVGVTVSMAYDGRLGSKALTVLGRWDVSLYHRDDDKQDDYLLIG